MSRATPSSSPRRDWRGRTPVQSFPAKSRWPRRLFLTVAVVLLCGLLVWLLWPPSFPQTRIVVLPIADYDPLIPPVPAAFTDVGDLSVDSLEDQETYANLSRLSNRLGTDPDEVLILYVSGHGVSDGGTAYLLCSDFLRETGGRPGEGGRYKLADLLRQVRGCPAKRKLLILDVGHILSDPRLGMIVNEFPRLLEEEIKAVKDEKLWVLTANRQFERSQVSYATRESAFSRFVKEGLQGAADEDNNRVIDLDELFRFVRRQMAGWIDQHADQGENQRPRLYWCGGPTPSGTPQKLPLVVVQPPAVEATSDSSGAEAKSSVADAKASGAEAKGTAAEPKPAASAAKTPDQRARARDLLRQAWQYRDGQLGQGPAGAWSPVDYAPHLWREFEGLLLGYEQRYRYGQDKKLSELGELTAKSAARPGGGENVLDRLAAAQRRFEEGKTKENFAKAPAEFRPVEEAIRLKNRAMYSASYYVRWCARASLSSPRRHPSYDTLSNLLEKQLPELVALLEPFESAGAPVNASGAVFQEQLRKLTEQKDAVDATLARLRTEGLEREAADVLEAARLLRQKATAGRIESLLCTPLVSCDTRMKLLDALERLGESPPAATGSGAEAPDEDAAVAAWQWDRVLEQAALETRLVRLAGPGVDVQAKPGEFARADTPEQQRGRWTALGQLGQQLGQFYAGIPGRINEDLPSGDPQKLDRAGRLLRLVDARDVFRKIGEPFDAAAVRPLVLAARVRPYVQLPEGKEGKLRRDGGWTPLEVRVGAADAPAAEGSLTLQYDERQLEVRDADKRLSIHRGDPPMKIALDGGARTLRLEARPRDVSRPVSTPMSLHFEADHATADAAVQFVLASEDVVELVIERRVGSLRRIEETQRTPDGSASVVLCEAFPNRVSEFLLSLKNRSGRERQVTVEFYLVPERASARGEPRTGPLDEEGRPLRDFQPLAGPLPVKLPADDKTLVVVPFPDPKAPAGKEDGQAAAKPGEKPKPDKQPAKEPGKEPAKEPAGEQAQGPLIPNGLVCVVRDAAGKQSGKRWKSWIDFKPVPPVWYLVPKVSYRAAERRINIRVSPGPKAEALPPISDEQPIKVQWDIAGVFPPKTDWKTSAELTGPGSEATLFAEVPQAVKSVPVRLTVDGYPRAFVYAVDCGRDAESVEASDNLCEIRIVAPKDGAVFAVSPENTAINALFQVDAPFDAFRNPEDAVEISFARRGSPAEGKRRFHGDREVAYRLQELAPQGVLRVASSAGDFSVPLRFGQQQGKVDISAQLILPRHPAKSKKDSVTILLDADPPEVRLQAPGTIPQDGDLEVIAEAEDLSGIKKLEFFLDEKEKLAERGPEDVGKKIALPTKELNLKPGLHRVTVKASDNAGHTRTSEQSVTVEAKAPKPDMAAAMSSIGGKVFAKSGLTCWDIEVQVKELSNRPAQVQQQTGQFTVADVPPGNYTIVVKAKIGNSLTVHSASVPLTVTAEPARVDIPIE